MRSFLISHVVLVGVALAVMVIWIRIVALIFRSAGFNLPLGRKRVATIDTGKNLKDLSKPWYVFVSGVILWGWPVAIAMYLYDCVQNKYLAGTNQIGFSKLVESMIVGSLAGLIMGFVSWKSYSSKDKNHRIPSETSVI
jgi:hypothetical protein